MKFQLVVLSIASAVVSTAAFAGPLSHWLPVLGGEAVVPETIPEVRLVELGQKVAHEKDQNGDAPTDGAETGVVTVGYCTATVIGPNLMLTARHCLLGFTVAEQKELSTASPVAGHNALLDARLKTPASFAYLAGTNYRQSDMAVVAFADKLVDSKGKALSGFKLDFSRAKVGQKVRVIGYGMSTIEEFTKQEMVGDPLLRSGWNKVFGRDLDYAYLSWVQAIADVDHHATLLPGDSGGPLLLPPEEGGHIKGVAVQVGSKIIDDKQFLLPIYESLYEPKPLEGHTYATSKIQYFLNILHAGADLPKVHCTCETVVSQETETDGGYHFASSSREDADSLDAIYDENISACKMLEGKTQSGKKEITEVKDCKESD